MNCKNVTEHLPLDTIAVRWTGISAEKKRAAIQALEISLYVAKRDATACESLSAVVGVIVVAEVADMRHAFLTLGVVLVFSFADPERKFCLCLGVDETRASSSSVKNQFALFAAISCAQWILSSGSSCI